LKIRFYGKLREEIGGEIDLDPSARPDTVAELRIVLAKLFPNAAEDLGGRSRACIADYMISEDHCLAGVATVEFFPPLSGG